MEGGAPPEDQDALVLRRSRSGGDGGEGRRKVRKRFRLQAGTCSFQLSGLVWSLVSGPDPGLA